MTKSFDQLELIPPYCPNFRCVFHLGTEEKFYVKNGMVKTDKAPFWNQRFRCKSCGEQFSTNTFGLDFRRRVPFLSERILHFSMHGMSNNSIARLLKVAEGTVRDRISIMSEQSLYFEKKNYPKRLNEDVAYDGFETFTYSQYSPCYINTAVGSRSMFIYHNTFSPLNRKGRMTDEQKVANQELIKKHGLYPQDSVYQETMYVLKNLTAFGSDRTFYTDEHKAYQRAFKSVFTNLEHETISSKAKRNASNPLFPINRLHQLYRHFFSSQHRETISFQKHEAALMDKIQLMKIYRNFMNPKFVKKIKFDPYAHEWSPAMYVGVASHILKFEEVYGIRRLGTQVQLDSKEVDFINRNYPFSRQKIAV